MEEGQSSRTEITLASGTKLSVTVSVDIFALSVEEREFFLSLIDSIKEQLTRYQTQQQQKMQE